MFLSSVFVRIIFFYLFTTERKETIFLFITSHKPRQCLRYYFYITNYIYKPSNFYLAEFSSNRLQTVKLQASVEKDFVRPGLDSFTVSNALTTDFFFSNNDGSYSKWCLHSHTKYLKIYTKNYQKRTVNNFTQESIEQSVSIENCSQIFYLKLSFKQSQKIQTELFLKTLPPLFLYHSS